MTGDAFPELAPTIAASADVITPRWVVAAILAAGGIADPAMLQFRRDVRIVATVTGRSLDDILDTLAPVYERCWDACGGSDRETRSIVMFLALYQTALFEPPKRGESS